MVIFNNEVHYNDDIGQYANIIVAGKIGPSSLMVVSQIMRWNLPQNTSSNLLKRIQSRKLQYCKASSSLDLYADMRKSKVNYCTIHRSRDS